MQAASPELPLGVAPVFTLDAGPGTIRGVEAEFGIVLGKTLLPQADMPFTIAEVGAARSACCAPPPPSRSRHCLPGHCLPAQVAGAIAEVVPVIEVVGTRTKGELAANVPLLVADHVRHGLCACMGPLLLLTCYSRRARHRVPAGWPSLHVAVSDETRSRFRGVARGVSAHVPQRRAGWRRRL